MGKLVKIGVIMGEISGCLVNFLLVSWVVSYNFYDLDDGLLWYLLGVWSGYMKNKGFWGYESCKVGIEKIDFVDSVNGVMIEKVWRKFIEEMN